MQFSNFNLTDIVTPINWRVLEQLLNQANYCPIKSSKLVQGFRFGFDLGYEGPTKCRSSSKNLPFSVGNKNILWNKLMKEIKLGHVAGPYDDIPFDYFIQSPIGLVPKDNGLQTRLIFHFFI